MINLRLTFVAILGIGATKAFARVVCDPQQNYGINDTATHLTASTLGHSTNQCIEDVCTGSHHPDLAPRDCGTLQFTITHLDTLQTDIDGCILAFHNILDQCLINEGVTGGIYQSDGVIYDITVPGQHPSGDGIRSDSKERSTDPNDGISEAGDEGENDDGEDGSDHLTMVRRGRAGSRRVRTKTRSRTRKKTKPKSSKVAPKTKSKTPKRPTHAKTRKTPKTPNRAKTPKKPSHAKTPVHSKTPKRPKNAKSKAKACPIRKTNGKSTKGKGKKTIRDLAEDLLPEVLHTALFPRVNKQTDNDDCDAPPWYTKKELSSTPKVEWWSFSRKNEDFEKTLPKTSDARLILSHMTKHGKFDVIKLPRATMKLVGDPDKAILPKDVRHGTHKHLLTNGGFFNPVRNMAMRYPIGETSFSTHYLPIPEKYEKYYEELRDGDQFLSAGPSLKQRVPIHRPEFRWIKENYNMAGSLAHARNSNERLAIAVVGRDKYIFTYTAVDRFTQGVSVNALRDLIDAFFTYYTTHSVATADKVLNLDGGGSIYVAWRENGRERVLIRGDVRDSGPPFDDGFPKGEDPRECANFLEFRV